MIFHRGASGMKILSSKTVDTGPSLGEEGIQGMLGAMLDERNQAVV